MRPATGPSATLAGLLALGAATATGRAQALMPRDGLATDGHMVAYDSIRHRLVAVGRHGETRELDGVQWLLRPGTGPALFGALAYRSSAKRTLAFGAGYDGTAQTWEYDGVAWQQRTPPVQPVPRERFAIAFDSWRNRVVVFSGIPWTGPAVADTWEWDGTFWQQRATTGPTSRQDAGLAFDAARGRCVLFGGHSPNVAQQNDTWEWDGTSWTLRTPATSPSPREGAPLAFDAARSRIVLHGGFALGPQMGLSDEVWEYDGTNWQLVGSGGPGAMQRHDLVYDPHRGGVLTAGNVHSSSGNADIWSWNGAQWTHVLAVPYQPMWGYGVRATGDPRSGGILMYTGATWQLAGGVWTRVGVAGAPAARIQVAMWSDGTDAWMFGGRDFFGPHYGDTFRWNGTNWVQATPVASPSPRARAAVAYDAVAGRAVLFGGVGAGTFNDTWLFDGVGWQSAATPVAPPPRHGHGMAFDPQRNRTVLFGGTAANGASLRDTWQWNGSGWSVVNPAVSPPAYGTVAMAYDGRSQRAVATQAPNAGSLVPGVGEVWSFDGATWTQLPIAEPRRLFYEHSLAASPATGGLFAVDGSSALELVPTAPAATVEGAPCSALAPWLAGRAYPEPGNASFGIDIVRAPPLGAVVLAGSLQPANVPYGACTLRLGPPFVVVVETASAAGFLSHPIPVPPHSALIGAQLWFQAAVATSVAPAAFTLSSALQVTVGG